MAKALRRRWGCVWAVALLLLAAGALYAWISWPGCVSYWNYRRIQVGMSREQVAALLGARGEETKGIPGYPAYVHLPGAPPGWTGVVWGETFVRWQEGAREIYVGFTQGRVTSKDYAVDSL